MTNVPAPGAPVAYANDPRPQPFVGRVVDTRHSLDLGCEVLVSWSASYNVWVLLAQLVPAA